MGHLSKTAKQPIKLPALVYQQLHLHSQKSLSVYATHIWGYYILFFLSERHNAPQCIISLVSANKRSWSLCDSWKVLFPLICAFWKSSVLWRFHCHNKKWVLNCHNTWEQWEVALYMAPLQETSLCYLTEHRDAVQNIQQTSSAHAWEKASFLSDWA